MPDLKVFIAESNAPEDFYHGRIDGYAANEVLKVSGATTRYRVVFTRELLRTAIREAAAFGADIFHLSCHGDADGIQLAEQRSSGDRMTWKEVAAEFGPFAASDKILVNSSCGGGHGGVAEAFRKSSMRFGYICGSTTDVSFHDSCIAWSILYNTLANESSISASTFRTAIKHINSVLGDRFVYRRWNEADAKYKYFPPRRFS